MQLIWYRYLKSTLDPNFAATPWPVLCPISSLLGSCSAQLMIHSDVRSISKLLRVEHFCVAVGTFARRSSCMYLETVRAQRWTLRHKKCPVEDSPDNSLLPLLVSDPENMHMYRCARDYLTQVCVGYWKERHFEFTYTSTEWYVCPTCESCLPLLGLIRDVPHALAMANKYKFTDPTMFVCHNFII